MGGDATRVVATSSAPVPVLKHARAVGAMAKVADRKAYLVARVPPQFWEIVEDLAVNTLAFTILDLPTRKARRAALDEIENRTLRRWTEEWVRHLFQKQARDMYKNH